MISKYTKSTHSCKIKVTKPNQKGSECFIFKIIPSIKQLYH
ncbi:hypothetical protein HMPREF0348_0534 [Enterococcus faecalis TX0104]|nr:hypothetical protein HMPREF0348_0534 [Enterococcus faecalis TX0104]